MGWKVTEIDIPGRKINVEKPDLNLTDQEAGDILAKLIREKKLEDYRTKKSLRKYRRLQS